MTVLNNTHYIQEDAREDKRESCRTWLGTHLVPKLKKTTNRYQGGRSGKTGDELTKAPVPTAKNTEQTTAELTSRYVASYILEVSARASKRLTYESEIIL
jgi:hypothetical protein